MRKRLLVSISILMVIMPLILATDLSIISPPDHRVSISILSTGEGYTLIDSFHKDTGPLGEVNITFTSSITPIDIGVLLRFNGEKVSYTRYGPFDTSKPITIDLTTGITTNEVKKQVDQIENNTIENEGENITIIGEIEENKSIENESSGNILGSAIENLKELKINKNIALISLAVVIIAIVFFLVYKNIEKFGKESHNGKGFWLYHKEVSKHGNERDLEQLERKLKEAKDEINKIKNSKDRIEQVQKEFDEARRELERLKRGH